MLNQPAMFATVGGVRSNEQFQVLKAGGEVIPGLYAIGGDNNTYCGAGYDVGIMAGSQQGWCATGGRLVAEQLFEA
ncbi:MAG: FAD-binding protein [Eggerthellaceae bacterium]|nr:FAD-binding protein [Eggerthellaceae bacterium]